MVRVRDEIKMTVQSFKTLYESSIAYGMRKALMAEQNRNEMSQNISDLETACKENEQDIKSLQEQIDEINRKDLETSEREEKAHNDQILYLVDTNKQTRGELMGCLNNEAPK